MRSPARGANLQLATALFAAALLAACLPSTESSPSAEHSPSVSASAVGNLPPGCEPIELRAPNGERIDLSGTWFEDAEGAPMTWRIKTEGDCIWGAGFVESIPYYDAADSGNIQTLRGHIGSDFAIDGEIVLLGPEVNFLRPPIYSPVRFQIEFDDAGQVILRENREPGVPGPRCVDPTTSCLRPLVLRHSDETI